MIKQITIDERYCPKNHPCPVVNMCPTGAITQKDFNSAPEIDEENCIQCGICTSGCHVFQCSGC